MWPAVATSFQRAAAATPGLPVRAQALCSVIRGLSGWATVDPETISGKTPATCSNLGAFGQDTAATSLTLGRPAAGIRVYRPPTIDEPGGCLDLLLTANVCVPATVEW